MFTKTPYESDEKNKEKKNFLVMLHQSNNFKGLWWISQIPNHKQWLTEAVTKKCSLKIAVLLIIHKLYYLMEL